MNGTHCDYPSVPSAALDAPLVIPVAHPVADPINSGAVFNIKLRNSNGLELDIAFDFDQGNIILLVKVDDFAIESCFGSWIIDPYWLVEPTFNNMVTCDEDVPTKIRA